MRDMLWWLEQRFIPHQPTALLCSSKRCETIAALAGVKRDVGNPYLQLRRRGYVCFVCKTKGGKQ